MRDEHYQKIAGRIFHQNLEQARYPDFAPGRLQRRINNDYEDQKIYRTTGEDVSRQKRGSGDSVPYNKDTAGNAISTCIRNTKVHGACPLGTSTGTIGPDMAGWVLITSIFQSDTYLVWLPL